jgi:hypothetical protein
LTRNPDLKCAKEITARVAFKQFLGTLYYSTLDVSDFTFFYQKNSLKTVQKREVSQLHSNSEIMKNDKTRNTVF